MQKLAVLEAKIDSIEEIKIDAKVVSNRVDKLEAHCERHDKQINSLENRSNTLEKFVRDNLSDSKKQMTSVYISIGMAIFSAILSFVMGFLK
jgi:DNA repair exonuclease SbcCD ATPase subunit